MKRYSEFGVDKMPCHMKYTKDFIDSLSQVPFYIL